MIALRMGSSMVAGLTSDAPGEIMPPIDTVRMFQRIDSRLYFSAASLSHKFDRTVCTSTPDTPPMRAASSYTPGVDWRSMLPSRWAILMGARSAQPIAEAEAHKLVCRNWRRLVMICSLEHVLIGVD